MKYQKLGKKHEIKENITLEMKANLQGTGEGINTNAKIP